MIKRGQKESANKECTNTIDSNSCFKDPSKSMECSSFICKSHPDDCINKNGFTFEEEKDKLKIQT